MRPISLLVFPLVATVLFSCSPKKAPSEARDATPPPSVIDEREVERDEPDLVTPVEREEPVEKVIVDAGDEPDVDDNDVGAGDDTEEVPVPQCDLETLELVNAALVSCEGLKFENLLTCSSAFADLKPHLSNLNCQASQVGSTFSILDGIGGVTIDADSFLGIETQIQELSSIESCEPEMTGLLTGYVNTCKSVTDEESLSQCKVPVEDFLSENQGVSCKLDEGEGTVLVNQDYLLGILTSAESQAVLPECVSDVAEEFGNVSLYCSVLEASPGFAGTCQTRLNQFREDHAEVDCRSGDNRVNLDAIERLQNLLDAIQAS